MNITIIGHVCIDNNVSENAEYTAAGSPAIFMEKVYRKFSNVSVKIISPYGSDFLPYLQDVIIFPYKPTCRKTLIYKNNSLGNIRSQKAFNRKSAKPPIITIELKQIISQADVIFFASLTPNYSSRYVSNIIKLTKRNSLKILLPQGYFRSFDKKNNVIQRDFKEAETLISLFDFIIVSNQDHKDIDKFTQNWAKVTNVIMTLGSKGSLYLNKNKSLLMPVEPVKEKDIVDSVGSGDIFSAAFGYQYFLTKDVKKSLTFANDIARQCLFFSANNLKFVFRSKKI